MGSWDGRIINSGLTWASLRDPVFKTKTKIRQLCFGKPWEKLGQFVAIWTQIALRGSVFSVHSCNELALNNFIPHIILLKIQLSWETTIGLPWVWVTGLPCLMEVGPSWLTFIPKLHTRRQGLFPNRVRMLLVQEGGRDTRHVKIADVHFTNAWYLPTQRDSW